MDLFTYRVGHRRRSLLSYLRLFVARGRMPGVVVVTGVVRDTSGVVLSGVVVVTIIVVLPVLVVLPGVAVDTGVVVGHSHRGRS